jgi:outer membrane protein OmpA-like peptidoglycan-associated protein
MEKNIGYFASNREGNDDIFSADPICNVEAIVMVKDKETNMPLANAIVNAMDSKNNKIGSSTTDENGVAKFTTACDEEHGFQVNREGYLSNSGSMSKARGGSTNTTIDLEPIKVIITEKEVILQPIFFEYNKSNITAQGAEELNKLVAVMNEYPNMVIFAKSHTDNRGNDSFNLKLSERRAKATVQYIISKGIDTTRISGQGFGETEPKDNCQECSDEQHATNRRSEFLIIKK